MSEENFEPKALGRTDSGIVIVFDPVQQTLKTAKLKGLDGKRPSFSSFLGSVLKASAVKQATIKPVPKWGSRVSIYEESPDSKRMIATLNLDKLDWLANMKRHIGLISKVYVMEVSTTTIAVT